MLCVSTTQLDRWLKSVDGLAGLPADEIDERIEALEGEQESIRLKLAVLRQIRPRESARPRARTEPLPTAHTTSAVPSTNGARPYDWKRRAVLDLIRSQPERVWKAVEVRDGLIANGTMKNEEGTSTYTLLRRLAERREIVKIGAAAYKSRPITDNSKIGPEFPTPGSSQQVLAEQGDNQE